MTSAAHIDASSPIIAEGVVESVGGDPGCCRFDQRACDCATGDTDLVFFREVERSGHCELTSEELFQALAPMVED